MKLYAAELIPGSAAALRLNRLRDFFQAHHRAVKMFRGIFERSWHDNIHMLISMMPIAITIQLHEWRLANRQDARNAESEFQSNSPQRFGVLSVLAVYDFDCFAKSATASNCFSLSATPGLSARYVLNSAERLRGI